jgi:protein involved in polysaccharide export with SLBB domain
MRRTLADETDMRDPTAKLVVLLLCGAQAWADPPPVPPEPPVISDGERAALEGDVIASDYQVGPGDKLRIELWGLQELTQDLEVNAEGRLFVPRAGVFEAAGQTLAGLRTAVEKRLHDLYPRERASLTLIKPRTFLVHVTGAVARPGTYPATPMTRVSALLPRAGGALPYGSLRRIELHRRSGSVNADLVRFTLLGELGANPCLLDGDTVYVPPRGLTVEVNGAVRRPGSYELVAERTLAELLVLAGGRAPQASRELPVRVTRRGSGDRLDVRSVELQLAAATTLEDGDTVHVPQLTDGQRMVVVEGAVVGPPGLAESQRALRPDGQADLSPREVSVPLPFVAGDGTRDLLAKAGGLQPWADARKAYLSRADANGVRRHLPVDLSAISTGAREEVPIAPGDTLVVPSRREQVLVGGAVQRPGFYQLSPDLKPAEYINLAGGPTRTGNPGGARVLSAAGSSKPIGKVGSLQPGDVITVPERRVSTAEWVEITLILGNIAVSAAAVGLAAGLR